MSWRFSYLGAQTRMFSKAIDPLGDGISSVELIVCMGDDLSVVNAARVSMHKRSNWEVDTNYPPYGTNGDPSYKYSLKPVDAKLIRYLSSHSHWTPFAHVVIQFRIKMPIFVAREWYRHEVGLVRNEVSRRYVTEEPEFFVPEVWRKKPEGNIKQGSGANFTFEENSMHDGLAWNTVRVAKEAYTEFLKRDVAPEMARMILPQNMYTEFIETGSLAAYGRIAGLRIAPDAMGETNKFAQAVASLIEPLVPVSWDALRNHNPMETMRGKYEKEIVDLNYMIKELEKQINNLGWQVNPDRMGQ